MRYYQECLMKKGPCLLLPCWTSQHCFVAGTGRDMGWRRFYTHIIFEKHLLKFSHAVRKTKINAGFRLACRLPHCRFDVDICSTAPAPLGAEGWPSGKQRQANKSITLPLCPPRQIADSWILFNSGAMPLGDKAAKRQAAS